MSASVGDASPPSDEEITPRTSIDSSGRVSMDSRSSTDSSRSSMDLPDPRPVYPNMGTARFVVLIIVLLCSVWSAGLIFGWAPLYGTLLRNGVYADSCPSTPSPPSNTTYLNETMPYAPQPTEPTATPASMMESEAALCDEQQRKLNIIYTAGAALTQASLFVSGILLDWLGPKFTATLSAMIVALGALLFGVASHTRVEMFVLGYALMGFGGAGINLSTFTFANLFPYHKSWIVSALVGVWTLSSLWFLMYRPIFTGGIPLYVIFYAQSGLVFLTAVIFFLTFPSRSLVEGERYSFSRWLPWNVAYYEQHMPVSTIEHPADELALSTFHSNSNSVVDEDHELDEHRDSIEPPPSFSAVYVSKPKARTSIDANKKEESDIKSTSLVITPRHKKGHRHHSRNSSSVSDSDETTPVLPTRESVDPASPSTTTTSDRPGLAKTTPPLPRPPSGGAPASSSSSSETAPVPPSPQEDPSPTKSVSFSTETTSPQTHRRSSSRTYSHRRSHSGGRPSQNGHRPHTHHRHNHHHHHHRHHHKRKHKKKKKPALEERASAAASRGRAVARIVIADVLTMDFLLLTVWFSIQALFFEFYIATIPDALAYRLRQADYPFGPAIKPTAPAKTIDTYVMVFNLLFSVGFVFVPMYAWTTDDVGFVGSFFISTFLSFIYPLISIIPWLPAQFFSYAFYSAAIQFVYSCQYGFIASRFGYEHFGILVGIMGIVTACLIPLQSVLLKVTIKYFKGNFFWSYIVQSSVTLLLFSVVVWIWFSLRREKLKRKREEEAERRAMGMLETTDGSITPRSTESSMSSSPADSSPPSSNVSENHEVDDKV